MSVLLPCPGCGENRKADEGHHICRHCEGIATPQRTDDPACSNWLPLTEEMVERAARVLHTEMFSGCVSWHDTKDSCTSGSEPDRRRALDFARKALTAALAPSTTEEQSDG